MKKLLVATNLIFAGIIYFQSCIAPKQVIVAPEGSRKNYVCFNYADSVFDGITYKTAFAMFDTYGVNQFSRITQKTKPNTDDSRFVWFSLDVIKKFIYKIENNLHTAGADPATRLGIRFYFGAYPDSMEMKTFKELELLPDSYAKRHTLYMVPTFDIKTKEGIIHQDFNAFKPISDAGRLQPSPLVTSDRIKTIGSIPLSGLGVTSDVFIQNHGEVGPPPQAGTIFQQ